MDYPVTEPETTEIERIRLKHDVYFSDLLELEKELRKHGKSIGPIAINEDGSIEIYVFKRKD